MRRTAALLTPFLTLVFAAAAPAQNKPAKPGDQGKPPAKGPAPASKPAAKDDKGAPAKAAPVARIAPTFESLHVKEAELPKGWKLDKELATVSIQPVTLMEGTLEGELYPKTRHKDFQTIVGPAAKGSILYFEWEGGGVPGAVGAFVPGLLWGEEDGPTRQHPETLAASGGVMLIVSFPLDSAERKWVLDRLRQTFGVRAMPSYGALKPTIARLGKFAVGEGEVEDGLNLASEHEKELAKCSFAAYLEAEIANRGKDWPRAEKAYARALALEASSDPLPTDDVVWASRDGLGTALYFQKKYADSIRELTAAAKLAADLKKPKEQAHCLYNCACAQALDGKASDAIASLKQCFALDPTQKANAAKDEDFASLKAKPEFQALLK